MRPQDANRAPRVAALYGVPGVGKSTLAAAFASATRTRRVFSDGVAWLAAGPGFQVLAAARDLLQLAAPGTRLPETDSEVDVALAVLGGRELLIVLDDVRDPDTALPFVKALGPGGRVLLTTLDQAVATALGAIEIAVDQLDDEASRGLLAEWVSGPLPAEAEVVLEACDGLPFALAIVGAMIANRTPWRVVAEALDARRLDLLAGQFPEYPHRTVLGVLAASFDALAADNPRAADCYLELAGFQPGAVLTRSAMIRLWSRPDRLTPLEAELVLPVLERRLLLHGRPGGDGFTLHSLHESFVRLRHPDPPSLARALVASYQADKGPAEWADLDDDGYLFDNLIGHLAALDDRATVLEVVTRAWIQRQWLRRRDLGQALDDARRAIDLAAGTPVDLASLARLGVLSGQIAATLRRAPSGLVGALASVGDVDQALRWAGDKPDAAERFAALVAVAGALLMSGALSLARRVCRVAAETIASVGGTVEAGSLPGLTALNAVHALVDFPYPDQWEGTNDELVAMARLPLDALEVLAPLAWRAGAVADLVLVTNPSWELYGHLIPLVAVEELAAQGEPSVAEALLDAYPQLVSEDDADDLVNAARYRHAIAAAAVGRFEAARDAIDRLPADYQGVGRRGLARNLARTGRIDEAVELLGSIDDRTVAEDALSDIVETTLARAVPEECRRVAVVAEAEGQPAAADWLSAAAGDPGAGRRFVEAEDATLALRVGVTLADIHWQRGAHKPAMETVRALVPIAERALGPQWWAPDTLDIPQQLADPAASLAALLVRTRGPMPAGFVIVTTGIEQSWGATPRFKLTFIREFAASGRFGEALELTSVGLSPGGRALGLANALLAVDVSGSDPGLGEQVRAAARDLADELHQEAGGEELDDVLADVLMAHGLEGEISAVADALDTRTDLPRALSARATLLAGEGRGEQIRELARRILADRRLTVPDAKARAMVLTAVAACRGGRSPELEAAARLLADVEVAAGALDVLAEVIDLHGRNGSLDTAADLAKSIPAGPVAELADALPSSRRLEYPLEITERDIAAAAVARAVAAAAMVLVAVRAGRKRTARKWLRLAEQFLAGANWVAPYLNVSPAVARYLWAARYALDSKIRPEDASLAASVAWYLWDRGHRAAAVRLARELLDRPRGLLPGEQDSGPRILDAEDYLRDVQVDDAVRGCLAGLVAMAAAADGNRDQMAKAIAQVDLEALRGLPSLGLAEHAEYYARVAIGLHRAGEPETAIEMLQLAAESSLTMARRGELTSFQRLCQAVVELLPPDEAVLVWAQWLQAAAQSDAYVVLGIIASYVRWLPAADLAGIVVNPETGDLEPGPR
jgi:tetratricopeptide (TPR) repeat protein